MIGILAATVAIAEGATTIIYNMNNGLPIGTNLMGAMFTGGLEGAIVGATVVGLGGVAVGLFTPIAEISAARIGTAIILGAGANLITVGKALGAPAKGMVCP